MTKVKVQYVCESCGTIAAKWFGKCTACGAWNACVEQATPKPDRHAVRGEETSRPQLIETIVTADEARWDTGSQEFNRVLGGGLVAGSFVLVGGDPGIGKSTLLLQTAYHMAQHGQRVLYVSGEESAQQIKMRAERLGLQRIKLYVLCATNMETIEQSVFDITPDVMIIDSIQTVYHAHIPSTPGSVAQVRECTGTFLRLSKQRQMATLLVGHVTKEGTIAGPRMLEHMVDTVLSFEGERQHAYRLLRAIKNRFGSTNELGMFEMVEHGLIEVTNPSKLLLAERLHGVAGSVVVASIEGTRPVLVEVQALVTATHFPSPRRMTTGIDTNRLHLLVAVLEKRVGLHLQMQDTYVNVVGGLKLDEPAVDLAIAVALASSFRDRPTPSHDLVFGEVGLTGEVRGVSRVDQRVQEAVKMGFQRIILPAKSVHAGIAPQGVALIAVHSVEEALQAMLG